MNLQLYTEYQIKHVRIRTTSMRNIENIAKKSAANIIILNIFETYIVLGKDCRQPENLSLRGFLTIRKTRMIKNTLSVLTVAVLTVGCATNQDYKLYSETQQIIAHAEAQKEAARYLALAEIAKQGDTAAKVAAVMSIQFNGGGGNSPKQQVAAPVSTSETALRWAGVLLPTFGQFYTISQNSKVAITQSNNSTALGMKQSDNQTAVAINTNSAFTTMNGNMATSNTAIANAGLTTANNIATTGLTTASTIATTGLSSVTSVANTGMNNLSGLGIKLVDALPLLQPNVTTTTTSTSTTTNN